MSESRYWENWDRDGVAKKIDDFWLTHESNWYLTLAQHIRHTFGTAVPLLEVGCGSGVVYQSLLKLGVVNKDSYIGADISESMLRIARQRFPGASLLELDIFRLPFVSHSQPNVICVSVLQHLPGYTDAMAELLRITRDRLYVVSWFVDDTNDRISLKPSPQWGQRFFENHYSMNKFIRFVKSAAVHRVNVHDFRYSDVRAVTIDVGTSCSTQQTNTTRRISYPRETSH